MSTGGQARLEAQALFTRLRLLIGGKRQRASDGQQDSDGLCFRKLECDWSGEAL